MTRRVSYRIVTTSWDDGSPSDIMISQLLSRYHLRGTFYVSPSYGYEERPLYSDEICSIGESQEIGAHTMTHPEMDKISLLEARREAVDSKRMLENVIGREVLLFGFPKGRYNQALTNMLRDCGFIGARTCDHRGFAAAVDPYQIPVTMLLSNCSPLESLRLQMMLNLSPHTLFDYEDRAKDAFNRFLERGGVFHVYGHASHISKRKDWPKVDRVLEYISRREGVLYLTNGEMISSLKIVQRESHGT